MIGQVFLSVAMACLLTVGGQGAVVPGTNRELVVIDGHETTIATASADEITGADIALSFTDLVLSIVLALNEPEFDYWGNVQEEVEALVGSYINEHNMNQVEAYEKDLETLLLRYLNAPVESENYPDKNQQAAALSMAIMSHRYLVMSGDLRFSLILHFEDIASMHIIVLKDAAETYSTEDSPSLWWVDLNEELLGYIEYSGIVRNELEVWRMDMITCTEDINSCRKPDDHDTKGTCYDIYTVTDGVTEEVSECRQLHGNTECVNHCQTYVGHLQQELDLFAAAKIIPVTDAWTQLQAVAQDMADQASPYYDPAKQH